MEPAPSEPSLGISERAAERTPFPKDEDGTMGRYERRIFLDRLVEMREAYQTATHQATSMTTDGAIAYAIDLFDDTDRLEAILADGSTDNKSASNLQA